MNAFLRPAEKPKGFALKLAYHFNKKQLGKVIGPLSVLESRIPPAFVMYFSKIEQLNTKLKIPFATNLLVRHQVARINNCAVSVDRQRWGIVGWSTRWIPSKTVAHVRFVRKGK
jgi:hypothetical protein